MPDRDRIARFMRGFGRGGKPAGRKGAVQGPGSSIVAAGQPIARDWPPSITMTLPVM